MTPDQLRTYRESLGLTQLEFAERFGLKRQKTISDYESGKQPVPQWLIIAIGLDHRASQRYAEHVAAGLVTPDPPPGN